MKNLFLIFLLFFSLLDAKEYEFKSKEERVNLIELYTSQGCSSCPPADRWLSDLKDNDKLFKDFIPLAFHVTYWDYIGWKDKFASKNNDLRQKIYSIEAWKKNSIYTPQFVVDAKEYRTWFWDKSFPKLSTSYGGNLNAVINEKNQIKINYFNKNTQNKNVLLNIAVLGFDYDIKINRGENFNRILKHDFVVLNHTQIESRIKDNKLVLDTKLNFEKQEDKKYSLVVWVEDYKLQKLQAVGGYFK